MQTNGDRYDYALSVNALGPGRLLSFGKECKKLKLFLHISTGMIFIFIFIEKFQKQTDFFFCYIAYVTGKKEGTILEAPLCIGENISSDLNIESELKLASEAVRKFHGSEEFKKLKELGIER